MAARSFKFEGVILATRAWGEKDRFLWLFDRYRGKIGLLARGVRDSRSRRSGILITANIIRGVAYRRPGGIAVAGDLELLYSPWPGKQLGQLTMLLYLGEVLTYLLPENEPENEVFRRLLAILLLTERRQQTREVVKFSIQLPALLGFGQSAQAWRDYRLGQLVRAQRRAEQFLMQLTERKLTSLSLLASLEK